MVTDNYLIAFKAISNFTTCLGEVFGSTHRPLKLYAHLISKTTFAHEVPIQKHITAFRDFCVANREAIASNNFQKLDPKVITYSARVYIDLGAILGEAKGDSDTRGVIWKHLLTISALVDPTGRAKEILQESICRGDDDAHEADFLSGIIGKVEQHVDPNASPMEAVSSIMKSGIFTELVGGMGNGLQDGSLDIGKLMCTVQKMVTTLNDQIPGSSSGGDGDPMGLVNMMMSTLNAGSKAPSTGGAPQAMPDLSAMMGMLGPLMGGMSQGGGGGGSGNSLEDSIDAQVKKARKAGTLRIASNSQQISQSNIQDID